MSKGWSSKPVAPTPMRIAADMVVNAAGLGAQALARSISGMPAEAIPPLHLAKGNYFSLSGRSPFSRLIYPMPTPGGLGVHLTLDLAGQARFGPDVEWVDAIDYDVDPGRAASFYAAIRTYWPDLPDDALQPAYAGIRPKIARPGGSATDFLLQTEKDHGVVGLINLFGIEFAGADGEPGDCRLGRGQATMKPGEERSVVRLLQVVN